MSVIFDTLIIPIIAVFVGIGLLLLVIKIIKHIRSGAKTENRRQGFKNKNLDWKDLKR